MVTPKDFYNTQNVQKKEEKEEIIPARMKNLPCNVVQGDITNDL